MDMQKTNNDLMAENSIHTKKATTGLIHRVFTTNWGLAVIGGLVALGIGISMLHGGHVESHAEQVPEAETVTVFPIS